MLYWTMGFSMENRSRGTDLLLLSRSIVFARWGAGAGVLETRDEIEDSLQTRILEQAARRGLV